MMKKEGINCPVCDVEPGNLHECGCTVEQCPYCGGQLFSCCCEGLGIDDVPDDDRMCWTGEWPGVHECKEFGWYAQPNPNGKGWIRSHADEPNAVPDLNRLYVEATWDRQEKRFVLSQKHGLAHDAYDANEENRGLTCSCCGCPPVPGENLQFYHYEPTVLPEAAVRGCPSEKDGAGPDDLLDFAAKQREQGFHDLDRDEAIEAIELGDFVNLAFLVKEDQGPWLPSTARKMQARLEAELMWVFVTDIVGVGCAKTYRGILSNQPVFINPEKLSPGCSVTFHAEHIREIITGDDENCLEDREEPEAP